MNVKKGFVLLIAFVFISFLAGCGGSGGNTAPPVTVKGTLSGVVKFGANPMEGALLTLSGPKAITDFTTGADGKFLFSNLDIGEYDLTVTKSGFHKYMRTVKITEGDPLVTLSCPLNKPYNALYGGSEDDLIGKSAMAVASDGTLWIAAKTQSSDDDLAFAGYHGKEDGWLLHIDPSKTGKDSIILSKCFGGTSDDALVDIKMAPDGTLWLLGYTDSTNGDLPGITVKGNRDAWLMHVDTSGTIISNARFGGSNVDFDVFSTLCLAFDGTLWLGGKTQSSDKDLQGKGYHGGDDVALFHIASDGKTILSAKCFGGGNTEDICGILENPDGSIFFAINTLSANGDLASAGNHGGEDLCLFRIASDGETILSAKCFGGSGEDHAYSFEKAQDGSLLFAAHSSSSDGDVHENKGNRDAWLFNVAPDGTTLQSSRTFGGSSNDYFTLIVPMNDGSLWIIGDTGSSDKDLALAGNHGLSDGWVMHLLPDGTLDYSKCFGGSDDEFGVPVCYSFGTLWLGFQTWSNDGDIKAAGLVSHGGRDAWITNIDVTNY